MKYFVAGATARTTADLAGIHRNTATRFFRRLRERIALKQHHRGEQFGGEVGVGPRVILAARARASVVGGQAARWLVFGILKRGGKVYTRIVLDASASALMPVIRRKIRLDSVVYTDSWGSYNALDVAGFRHCRINHSERFARDRNHINGIENFWNQAKRHLRRFNGVPRQHFDLFLKECEWRFNIGAPNKLLADLKKLLKEIY